MAPQAIPFCPFKSCFQVSCCFEYQLPAPATFPVGPTHVTAPEGETEPRGCALQKHLLVISCEPRASAPRCGEEASSFPQSSQSGGEKHIQEPTVPALSDKDWPRDMFRCQCMCRGRRNFSSVVLNSHICKMEKTFPASSHHSSEGKMMVAGVKSAWLSLEVTGTRSNQKNPNPELTPTKHLLIDLLSMTCPQSTRPAQN